LLLLLYGEMDTMLGWMVKKKRKRFILRIYWYGALILLLGSLFQEYGRKKSNSNNNGLTSSGSTDKVLE
jgi:hypothetical protein